MALSRKQLESYQRSNHRLNVWEGAVRSGKSFVALLRFIKAIKDGPPGDAMIIGPSRDSIQRNVVSELCNYLPIRAPTPKMTQMQLYGRTIHFVGAADERAQRRIQGSTLAIAYVDEITLLPQGFFRMLLSRLSVGGAQLFGTTNPDSPYHWLKTDFLDRAEELDLVRFPFRLEDNPSLTRDYVNNIKKEYQGLFYERYVEGKWVLADGLVYSHFNYAEHTIMAAPGQAEYYTVGIDYGTTNPTSFLLIGVNTKTWPNIWVEKEYYWDSARHQVHKTDTDYAEDFKQFIRGYNVRAIYMDPCALSLRTELIRQSVTGIMEADNDILNGIRFVSQQLANGTLKIATGATHTIREFGAYAWDSKASIRGEDRPQKSHDHCMDALRYAIYTHFGKKTGSDVSAEEIDKLYLEAKYGIQSGLPPQLTPPHQRYL